jgi:hypothetical protein
MTWHSHEIILSLFVYEKQVAKCVFSESGLHVYNGVCKHSAFIHNITTAETIGL